MHRSAFAALVIAAAITGCSNDELTADAQTVGGRLAGQTQRAVSQFDLKAAQQVAAQAFSVLAAGQPVSKVSCPPHTIRRDGLTITATCTGRLKDGSRVRVPVRYIPGVGLTPGVPTVSRG